MPLSQTPHRAADPVYMEGYSLQRWLDASATEPVAPTLTLGGPTQQPWCVGYPSLRYQVSDVVWALEDGQAKSIDLTQVCNLEEQVLKLPELVLFSPVGVSALTAYLEQSHSEYGELLIFQDETKWT